MTTLKYFKPSADGFALKEVNIESTLNPERSMNFDNQLASVLSDRTMSLDEKYNSIRSSIANIGTPSVDTDNRFTI